MVFSPKIMKGALDWLGGPATPANYLCVFTPPMGMLSAGLGGILSPILTVGGLVNLSIMASSVSIPGRSFMTLEHTMFGTTRRLPYAASYDSLKIEFLCTNAMTERTFFDAWHQFIMSPSSTYMEYHQDYKANIVIKKLKGSGIVDSLLALEPPTIDPPIAEIGSILSTYVIQEAYPYRVGAQELSSSDGNTILKLDVDFYYTRWKSAIDFIFPGKPDSPSPI